MDEDKALEEKDSENMDHDGSKMEDPPASQAPDKQPNASVVPNGQHKSKAAAGAPIEQHADMVLAAQHDLAGAAGVQQDSMGDAGEALQHDDLEGKGSDSVRKKNAVKPVVLLTQTGMTPDGSA
jgi:hypothetical protein